MNENLQPEQIQNLPKKNNGIRIIAIVAAVVIFAISWFCGGNNFFTDNGLNSLFTRFDEDAAFVNAAKDLICNNLKNPDSAVFNDAYIVEKDSYGRAIVYIDVTSENSFGGAARDVRYVCIQSVDSDGTYTYKEGLSISSDGSAYLNILKELNNFDEPKS